MWELQYVFYVFVLTVIGCLNTQFTRDKEALTPECLAALQSRHNMWNFTGMVGVN